jgi:hypothetical protein
MGYWLHGIKQGHFKVNSVGSVGSVGSLYSSRLQGLLSLAHAAEHEALKPDFVGSLSHGLKRAASGQLSMASGRSLKSIAFDLRWLHNFNQVPLLGLFSLVLCLAGHALHSLVHLLAGPKGQLSLVHWKAGNF